MAGMDRGNMRCFEAMGCGALLLSDDGRYPQGMVSGQTMITYANPLQAAAAAVLALESPQVLAELATNGHRVVRQNYSKAKQWQDFKNIVDGHRGIITL